MLAAIRKPLAMTALLGGAVLLVAAVALYCFLYNLLQGRSESGAEGVLWALVNVAPWLFAFEGAKRAPGIAAKAAVFAAAVSFSLLLHVLFYGMLDQIGFEVARRIPGAVAVALLLGLISLPSRQPTSAGALPLLPRQIDWISAAGNYVELHAAGRTIVHRAPLGSVEAELVTHGFVRIHRSTLVRKDAIARVRTVDLILQDGTSLKLGKRYRSALGGRLDDFRPSIPAE